MTLALGFMQLQASIGEQKQRNRYLQSQIQALESRIGEVRELRDQRELMKERMAVVARLQGSRVQVVRTFDVLARAVPEGVVLDELRQLEQGLRISGTARSNAIVSSFMRRLDETDQFHSARLDVIKVGGGDKGGERQSAFVLEVFVQRPGAGE